MWKENRRVGQDLTIQKQKERKSRKAPKALRMHSTYFAVLPTAGLGSSNTEEQYLVYFIYNI